MPEREFDFLVVGSGAGGLAAAITAKLAGMRPLLIEKTALIGGSSVMSGGVLWLPNNLLMQREGVVDSREAALRYMSNFVEDEASYSTPLRRETYVDTVAPFMSLMEAQGMKYLRCAGYADYYDTLPGGLAAGRAVQAELFDVNRLGSWKARLRSPFMPLPIRTSEGARLMQVSITPAGKAMAARIATRTAWSKLRGQMIYGSGGALQGRMLEMALRLGVDIWTDAPLVDLELSAGRVTGAVVAHEGRPTTISVPRGVLITAGGFSRNDAMRKQYQRAPITDEWTHSNPGDTGEAIQAMTRVGAALALMEEAWWIPTWKGPKAMEQIIPELAKPHGMLVDQSGTRFINEANSYMELGRAMYARNAVTSAIPAWVVMDARHRRRYLFGGRFPGKVPADWLHRGLVKQDATLAGLARQCGIDPQGLEAGVQRFNALCETGTDDDFGRGSSAYNRYYADPTAKPNPCLGPISEPPFWAAPLYPGDVGTCGGAVVDERAQVLRPDGSVIDGLFAAGNCAASLCGPNYVGPGQSIGASSVFGFIAANVAKVS